MKEKQSIKQKVNDFFYETNRKLFYPNGRKVSKNVNAKRDKLVFIWVLLALPILHWLVFWLYVNMQTILLAFQHQRTGAFTLGNFATVWERITSPVNNDIGISLLNTLKYFGATVFITIPICLVISFFFYKRIAFYKGFRIIFYLPAIISGMVFVTAYTEFIDPNGPLGIIMKKLGKPLPEYGLLASTETATSTIITYVILTSFTTNVLLFSGGMARIPIDVLEAAKLEGCGPARELVSIVFPLIWPTFSTQLIFTMTGIFNATGPILLFTNGKYDTSTVAFWIFKQVYGDGNVGGTGAYNLVSCAGLCFTLIGVPLILISRKVVEKIDTVEY